MTPRASGWGGWGERRGRRVRGVRSRSPVGGSMGHFAGEVANLQPVIHFEIVGYEALGLCWVPPPSGGPHATPFGVCVDARNPWAFWCRGSSAFLWGGGMQATGPTGHHATPPPKQHTPHWYLAPTTCTWSSSNGHPPPQAPRRGCVPRHAPLPPATRWLGRPFFQDLATGTWPMA